MANACDKLNAYMTHESDEDEAKFNALLDELYAEALRDGAAALEARVADDDVTVRETWAGMDAALLRRMADDAGHVYPADFFQPGRTYTYGWWQFRCDAVTTHPGTGDRTALGWFRTSGGQWRPFNSTEDEWAEDGWKATVAEQAIKRPNGIDPMLILGANPNAQHRAGHVDIDSTEPTP